MALTLDRSGTFITCWKEVRNHVALANPEFARLVDEVSPDEKFPLLVANYEYGSLFGDDKSIFLPTESNEFPRLKLPNKKIPKNTLAKLLKLLTY